MIKKKILVIAPYPIDEPQHGGQKRVRAIVDYYKQVFQDVRFVAIFHRGFYPENSTDSILIGQQDIIRQLDENRHAAELISGKALDKDIHVRSPLAKLLMEFRPDIIQVEQIFPYAGLRQLLQELNMKPILILSSQNIESRMKRQIMDSLDVPKITRQSIEKETTELEQLFTREADLVIAVSEQDAAEHRRLGAKRTAVIPNGIDYTKAKPSVVREWRSLFAKRHIDAVITFVGSGHPPNWMGFIECVGMDTTFLPKRAKIVMAGGVSEYFKATYDTADPVNKKLWSGVLPVGFLDGDRLTALLEVSDVFLLPITSGGGSNLKTAEAILSGRKIVATSFAFRGFEKYLALPNIFLAETADDFVEVLQRAIDTPHIERTTGQVELARQVEWSHCLAPLERRIKSLLREAAVRKAVNVARFQFRKLASKILRRQAAQ